MSKFPWKTTLAGAALLAATVYAYAQIAPRGNGPMGMHGEMQHGDMSGPMAQMHQQMMQGGMGQGTHEGMHGGTGMHGGMHGQHSSVGPAAAGQDAFGAIQEVVQILEADPATDWSKVNIGALREHLIDMNDVTLHAAASEHVTNDGIEITVTGEGRTLAAIKRMVPAHVQELASMGWKAAAQDLPNGVTLTVTATEAQPIAKLKALGFMGIMVQGAHHQAHHLMMAKGEFTN
jgi:ribosomal protein L15